MNEKPTFDAPESNELTDEQLRAKAAQLANYVPLRWCNDGGAEDITECLEGRADAADECNHIACGGNWETCSSKYSPPPLDYPRDIAAAMELWDLLLADGYTVEMFSRKPGCYAVVIGYGGARYGDDIEDTSPARAITRAFVSVVVASPGCFVQ